MHEESLALARRLGTTSNVALALGNLGMVALVQGNYLQARVQYRETLGLLQHLNSDAQIAICLTQLAEIAVAFGEVTIGARLYGAAETLRDETGQTITLVLRERYERAVASARATLGEDVFTTAWAAGRALTRDEAIAEALSDHENSLVA